MLEYPLDGTENLGLYGALLEGQRDKGNGDRLGLGQRSHSLGAWTTKIIGPNGDKPSHYTRGTARQDVQNQGLTLSGDRPGGRAPRGGGGAPPWGGGGAPR